MYCWKGIMAGSVSEDNGVGRSLEAISSSQRCQSALEVISSSQRCQSAHSLAEWRSCEQVENGTPSTSPPYWDTDDGDDCGCNKSTDVCLQEGVLNDGGYLTDAGESVSPHLSLSSEIFWFGHQRKSGIGFAACYNTDKMGNFTTPRSRCQKICPICSFMHFDGSSSRIYRICYG